MSKVLTKEELTNVLGVQAKKDAMRSVGRAKPIFWGIGLINLQKAVKARKALFMHDNREFRIEYGHHFKSNQDESVFIYPTFGFVPSGYWRIVTIQTAVKELR